MRGANAEPTATGQDFGFEGTIDRMDARFAPDLREGLVLAGVYAFVGGPDSEDVDEAVDKAVYPNAVAEAELTFDRNHVWIYGAQAGQGDGGLELTQSIENSGRKFDLYAVTLPLEGSSIGEDGWMPRWLQLWFYGPEKKMLPNLAAQPPPESFSRGWWRITFWNQEGTESAVAEGRLTASGEAGAELNPSEQIAALEGVVVDLNRQLDDATSRVASLESELSTTRKRVGGLQSTIDLLVDERENLRSEVARLQEKQNETPGTLEKRIAEFEADELLWEERESAWEGQNRVMTAALSEAEEEVAQLKRALARAQREKTPPLEPAVVARPNPTPPVSASVVIVPSPDTVSETHRPLFPAIGSTQELSDPVASELPAAPVLTPLPENGEFEEDSDARTFKHRAGKFRRGRR